MSTDVRGNRIGDEEEAGVDDVQSEHSGDHHHAVKKVCSSMSVAIPRYDSRRPPVQSLFVRASRVIGQVYIYIKGSVGV